MGRKVIDLSLEIVPAESWVQFPKKIVVGADEPPTRIVTIMDNRSTGNSFAQRIETTTQSFTHIDAPSHFFMDGITNEQVPLEKFIGEAVVIDMMHKNAGEEITAEDLEKTGVKINSGDIVIIRTGWTDRAWGTEKFWVDMICLSLDAGDWLIEKDIKSLALDFYPDPRPIGRCVHCGGLYKLERSKWRNHHKFLKKGIILMEFLTNLGAIKKPRVTLICLPLKIKGSDGAPARVVAIEED